MAEWVPLEQLAMQALPGRRLAESGPLASHAAFHVRVLGWQQRLQAWPGRVLALHFEEPLAFAAALYGAWHAGKQVLLCADTLPATLAAVATQVEGWAGDFPASVTPRLEPVDVPAPVDVLPALDAEQATLLVFTSGSTGAPQAIEKRLRQLAREVEALESALGAGLGDCLVHGTVSHHHIYGLLFRVLWPLAAGRRIAPRRFFPEEIVAALAGNDSVLVASPAHLSRWPALPMPVDGCLRAVFSSGGPLSDEAAELTVQHLGVAPIEIFGSSETGGIAWRKRDHAAPAWQALPGVRWQLADGQLEVDSAHLPSPGWWRCADSAQPSGDGFHLLGRADRIVKIEERRVSLEALEQALCRHPAVAQARVLELPGSRATLAAVIVPTTAGWRQLAEGRRRLGVSLGEHLADSHEAVVRPRHWRFVEALPVNAQGKVPQQALATLFRPMLPQADWRQREARQARVALPLDPALRVFDGHFPQVAVLPGVAQLDWAIHYGREAFVLPPRFLRVDTLKFQQVARAGQVIELSLAWDPDKGCLQFAYQSELGKHASGKVMFATGHEGRDVD